ncbi:unnamed protein product [Penicillium roqueforti FM164]|uniref:Uncharacterized protein n=1 Tax=Penicillium roqueforti (strain FM164) TaxID=1365484 RepID=W6R8G4_PENRF|nr:unnamed protein product [Penicillium roqueforti FM164]
MVRLFLLTDSCRYIGESLRDTETRRIYYWHDFAVDISPVRNDLDASKDLQIWLTGLVEQEFLF